MHKHSTPESATSNAKLAVKSQPQHTPGNDLPHGDRQFLTNSQLQEILPLSRRSIFYFRIWNANPNRFRKIRSLP
jgi:hypothetical protein